MISAGLIFNYYQGEDFFSLMITLNFIFMILFFICKWGEDLIENVIQNEAHSNELLNNQQFHDYYRAGNSKRGYRSGGKHHSYK